MLNGIKAILENIYEDKDFDIISENGASISQWQVIGHRINRNQLDDDSGTYPRETPLLTCSHAWTCSYILMEVDAGENAESVQRKFRIIEMQLRNNETLLRHMAISLRDIGHWRSKRNCSMIIKTYFKVSTLSNTVLFKKGLRVK